MHDDDAPSRAPAAPDALAGLFEQRAPTAAARQSAAVLAWLVEQDLQHLESMRARASASRTDLAHRADVVRTTIGQCFDLGMRAGVLALGGQPCPRLDAWLSALARLEQLVRDSSQPLTAAEAAGRLDAGPLPALELVGILLRVGRLREAAPGGALQFKAAAPGQEREREQAWATPLGRQTLSDGSTVDWFDVRMPYAWPAGDAACWRVGRYRGKIFGGDEGLVDAAGEPLDSAGAICRLASAAIDRCAAPVPGAPAAPG